MVLALLEGKKSQVRVVHDPARPLQAGDRIRLLEAYATDGPRVRYAATDAIHELRTVHPPETMGPTMSRLDLVIEAVRQERLQDLTVDDAYAEGLALEVIDMAVVAPDYGRDGSQFYTWPDMMAEPERHTFVEVDDPYDIHGRCFASLWDQHHENESAWAANPLVDVLTLRIETRSVFDGFAR